MSRRKMFRFRLYVADDALNSALAIRNLTALCHAYLPERHHIEIIDVLREPQRALAESIFMTPTVVKLSPAPIRKIVGTLTDTATVLLALGLEPPAP